MRISFAIAVLQVQDVYLPIDKMTNESKGYAFVNFDSSEVAAELCTEGKFIVNDKEVGAARHHAPPLTIR